MKRQLFARIPFTADDKVRMATVRVEITYEQEQIERHRAVLKALHKEFHRLYRRYITSI